MTTCSNLDQIRDITPAANGCVDCLAAEPACIGACLCVRSPNRGIV